MVNELQTPRGLESWEGSRGRCDSVMRNDASLKSE
jgi:hypothetical protein